MEIHQLNYQGFRSQNKKDIKITANKKKHKNQYNFQIVTYNS